VSDAQASGGSLEQTSVPEVLRPLVRAKRTGVLRFTRRKIVKTVYLSGGRIIFATSTDPDDRLGEMLLRKGRISYRALEQSVHAMQAGKRQGTLLVENGSIRSKDLVEGVTEQVQEIAYGLFGWDDGTWEFVPGDLPSREVIVLRMSTADLVMEGIRRVRAWSRLRAGVGGLEQLYELAPDSSSTLASLTLHKDELGLLASLDGVMRVEDICTAARLSDFEVCRTVFAFWAAGVLDRVPQDRESASGELYEKTEPHAERLRGASVIHEIERFNQIHRFLFELLTWELRERASAFFERAFGQASAEHAALFEGVAVDTAGELDPFALRSNIVSGEIAGYVRGLDRLLAIESELAREVLGEKKAAIIQDGILALREQQLQGRPGA
jgi:hypothetical protein